MSFLEHSHRNEMIPVAESPVIMKDETGLTPSLSEDFAATKKVTTEFEEIASKATTKEQKQKLIPLRTKIAKAAKRFLKTVTTLSAIGFVVMTVDYVATHPDVEKKDDGKGHITYVHPDAETTHILNVLAGRETISVEENLENYRAVLKTQAETQGITLPVDYDTFNIDQLDKFFAGVHFQTDDKGTTAKPGEIKNSFNNRQYYSNVPENQSQKIYDLLWQVEQETGNPMIKFKIAAPPPFLTARNDVAYFNSFENTVYISMNLFIDHTNNYSTLLQEMSHAKDLKNNPIVFYLSAIDECIRIFSKSGFDIQKQSEAQIEEYEIPGSLEYQAHHIIGPNLFQKYRALDEINLPKYQDNQFGISFDVPHEAIIEEITKADDNQIDYLFNNFLEGKQVEIPNKLQIQILVADTSKDQDAYNDIDKYHQLAINDISSHSELFEIKIIEDKPLPESAMPGTKGYKIKVRNNYTHRDETIYLLKQDSDPRIFAVMAVYLQPDHEEEDNILEHLILSLKTTPVLDGQSQNPKNQDDRGYHAFSIIEPPQTETDLPIFRQKITDNQREELQYFFKVPKGGSSTRSNRRKKHLFFSSCL